MTRFEHNLCRETCAIRLYPAGGTDAPAIACFQARELEAGFWRDQVIPLGSRKRKKLIRHLHAGRVFPLIFLIGFTAAIPEKTGQWLQRTGTKDCSQNIFLHGGIVMTLASQSRVATEGNGNASGVSWQRGWHETPSFLHPSRPRSERLGSLVQRQNHGFRILFQCRFCEPDSGSVRPTRIGSALSNDVSHRGVPEHQNALIFCLTSAVLRRASFFS